MSLDPKILKALAGEDAFQQTQARGQGVGSMQAALLDNLQLLDHAQFEQRLKLSVAQW